MIRPSSITGSLAWVSAGGAIGWVAWRGGAVVVVVVVVVEVVVEVVVVVVVDVVVVVVVLVDVVGGSVVVVVLLVVVVGATVVVVATVVVAAWAVPPPSEPLHDVSSSVAANNVAVPTGAQRTHVSQDPPFPRANIRTIMSPNHRPSPSIA